MWMTAAISLPGDYPPASELPKRNRRREKNVRRKKTPENDINNIPAGLLLSIRAPGPGTSLYIAPPINEKKEMGSGGARVDQCVRGRGGVEISLVWDDNKTNDKKQNT